MKTAILYTEDFESVSDILNKLVREDQKKLAEILKVEKVEECEAKSFSQLLRFGIEMPARRMGLSRTVHAKGFAEKLKKLLRAFMA